jgi:hypothetical protein
MYEIIDRAAYGLFIFGVGSLAPFLLGVYVGKRSKDKKQAP